MLLIVGLLLAGEVKTECENRVSVDVTPRI